MSKAVKLVLHYLEQGPDIPVELFGYPICNGAGLRNPEEKYTIPLAKVWVCDKCGNELRQYSASSLGTGELRCSCSVWESAISPFSGTAHLNVGIKRTRYMTKKEKVEKALEEATIDSATITDVMSHMAEE